MLGQHIAPDDNGKADLSLMYRLLKMTTAQRPQVRGVKLWLFNSTQVYT